MTILRERQCLGHRAPRSLVGICNRGPFGATLAIPFAIWVAQIICCGLTYGPPRPCQMNQRKTTHFGGSHFETNEFGAPRVSKRCSFADSIGRIAGPRSILCLMSEEKAVVRFFFFSRGWEALGVLIPFWVGLRETKRTLTWHRAMPHRRKGPENRAMSYAAKDCTNYVLMAVWRHLAPSCLQTGALTKDIIVTKWQ